MPVLSATDLEFWRQQGYIVVPNAVPSENVEAAARAIWDFVEMDPDDPASWYTDPPRPGVMIEMYHHQALWDNRQSPRLHQAFADIWETEKLWVSLDRTSINPPIGPLFHHKGGLHWDRKLELPIHFGVQGVLYLSDTPAHQGAFVCVPGFHHRIEDWIRSLPDGVDPLAKDPFPGVIPQQDLGGEFEPVPIAAGAGDLIIWHSALPHSHSPNTGERPRVAQYITMHPAPLDRTEKPHDRIKNWKELLTGNGPPKKAKENATGRTAELTPLGRKLLGLDWW